MAKRNTAKIASKSRKSALRIESLEQRQLLATIVGGGDSPASYQNIVNNGNTYDQVLMTGASVTVTADAGQFARVSFLDLSGDIVQAEISGKGSLTITLDQFKGAAEATKYNQAGVNYVSGLASFLVQGSDATTNIQIYSVGSVTANGGAASPLFAGGKTGGNGVADIARILIVADANNAGGFSTMGAIKVGNAVFSDASGVVGIAASLVNVQGPVIIGDIKATNSGVPTISFSANSQFATLQLAGGDLIQANGALITNAGFVNVNSTDNVTSGGSTVRGKILTGTGIAWTGSVPLAVTLDASTTFDLTGLTQEQITAAFAGRTFTNSVTVSGDLASNFAITAAEFRGDLTFNGAVLGTTLIGTNPGTAAALGGVKNVTFAKGLSGSFAAPSIGNITSTGNVSANITAKSIGNVTITGNLSTNISTDYDGTGSFTTGMGEKAIGNVSISGNDGGRIVGVLGIGNITVGGNVTGRQSVLGTFATLADPASVSGDNFVGNIGTIAIAGDLSLRGSTTLTAAQQVDSKLILMTRGTFGNITVGGAGTLNSVDLSAATASYLGGIQVANGLTAASGTITVTDNASLVLGELNIKGTSTLGAISLTSGSVAQTTAATGAIVAGSSIRTTDSVNSTGSFTLSGLTLAGAEVINLGALQGRTITAVSATTIDTTNAVITVGAGTLGANGGINGTSSVGTVTLNAGVNGTVNLNADIGGVDAPAATAVNAANAAVPPTAFTTTTSGTNASTSSATNLTTVGAVTISGATVNFAADKGILAKAGLTSLTVTGAGAGTAQGVAFVAPTAGANIELGGTSGTITLNGNTRFNSTAGNATIRADNGLSSLDTIGGLTINGKVQGVGNVDVRASSIGDITIKGALNQTENLVTTFNVLAVNNGTAVVASNGGASLAETVSRDGTNLSGYSIGNITVQSTNTIGVTTTALFSGSNAFTALGKMGNITVAGGGSPTVQTSLFGAPVAGAGVKFVVGDADGLVDNAAAIDFDGNGAFTGTLNTNVVTTGQETAASFSSASTVSIGNISINAAGVTGTANSLLGVGGQAANNNDGLLILAGVKATTSTQYASNALVRNDVNLSGTIGTIAVTNLNQQLAVDGDADTTAPVLAAGFTTPGIIAAAGNTSTAANIGLINGVTPDFDGAADIAIIGDSDADGTTTTANEIVVIRI